MTATTLGEIAADGTGFIQTGPFGSQLHVSDYTDSGVSVVMPQDLHFQQIDFDLTSHISTKTADTLSKHYLRPGDIVYARRGNVDECVLIPNSHAKAICGTGCMLVRVESEHTDNRFLYYSLQKSDTKSWIRGHAIGATMPNLNTSIVSEIPVELPPLPEQHAIAEVLGALDDKIAANRKLVTTSLSLAQALHDELVTTGNVTPALYTDVAEVGGGATPKTRVPEYWDGDIHWASPTDITALGAPYLHNTSRHITQAGLDSCSSPLYPEGSILMTSRATIGAFAVAQEPTAVNQGFIVLTPKREELRWWLLHEMMGRVKEFQNRANGATFLELSKRTFKTMEFDLPSDAQVLRFDESARPLHEHAIALGQESQTLAQLRDTLLPALMDGTIRVKDAQTITEEAV